MRANPAYEILLPKSESVDELSDLSCHIFRSESAANDRVRHRAELDQLLAAWCAQRDLAEIQRSADAAGIGNARLGADTEAIRAEVSVRRDRSR